MQNVTQFKTAVLFINDLEGHFVARTLILGLLTFFFFFLLMRTLDKENIYKVDITSLIHKIKFLKYANAILLVKDGVLQLDKLYLSNTTAKQVYEALRNQKISNMAQVERLFLIPGGEFSIYRKKEQKEVPVYHYMAKELTEKQGKA